MINKVKDTYSKLYTPFVCEAGRIAFYIGLLFEVFIFLLDRADWINVYQSYMFRVTFIFFVIKCICTKYDKRQVLFILGAAFFSIITYLICGKDEVVRATVFIIAMKDLDLKRTLRMNLFLTTIGIVVLGLLSIFGVMGSLVATPGYADKADAFMLAFGLGSSNTWAIQMWVLAALFVFLYYDRLSKWFYLILAVLGVVVYLLSKTNTALIMFFFTALGGFILSNFAKLQKSKIIYILSGFVVLACTGFSVFAAKISKWWDFQPDWQRKLDTMLTGRITCIYAFENGGGVLSNWRLFGAKEFVQSFDMGIVRLFWWYGIIPGTLTIIAILILLYRQYKRSDYMGMLLVVSMIIFSVFEAHFISVFICRSYLLFMLGSEWYRLISNETEDFEHVAFYIGSLSKGGAERVFVNLAEYFISEGKRVTIITQYKKDNEYELPEGCERVISDITAEEEKGRIYNFFARLCKLHRILVLTNADIMLTTIGKNNFMAICSAIFIKTRIVVSIVADPKEEYTNLVMKLLMQILFPEADGIIMQTTQSLNFMKMGLDKKCTILPNSVSPNFLLDRFEGRREQNIFAIGRMDANKNQEMTIRAFAKICQDYPAAKLTIIGDGDLREYLEKLCAELDVSNKVNFTGIVSDVADRLYKAYAFVLTSYTEGMPNTLLEAMALGVACISTDCPCGGPYDLITPNKDGILIPVGDIDALAKELRKLLEDYDYADSLGINAHDTMQQYRPEIVNRKWYELFNEICNA